MLKGLINNLVNYVLPYRCSSCNELTTSSEAICASCWSKLNFIAKPYCNICGMKFELSIHENAICGRCITTRRPYELARSVLKFDQHSKNLIYAFKYNDKTSHARIFAKLLHAKYREDFSDVDFVAPVPMHRLKRVYRYYNQSQLLAREMAILMGCKMIPDLLIKTRLTKPQTGLSRKKRETNLIGSIIYNPKYDIRKKKILLADDVYTTGSTISLCCRILKRHGAATVKVSTIAMT